MHSFAHVPTYQRIVIRMLPGIGMTLIILTIVLAFGCGRKDHQRMLIGFWKKDSVYSYYNGFGFTKRDFDEEPLVGYWEDGKLSMKLNEEVREFSYTLIAGDTLVHHNRSKSETFTIVKIDDGQLTLRKNLAPLFKSTNQTRFEIRYLSRVK